VPGTRGGGAAATAAAASGTRECRVVWLSGGPCSGGGSDVCCVRPDPGDARGPSLALYRALRELSTAWGGALQLHWLGVGGVGGAPAPLPARQWAALFAGAAHVLARGVGGAERSAAAVADMFGACMRSAVWRGACVAAVDGAPPSPPAVVCVHVFEHAGCARAQVCPHPRRSCSTPCASRACASWMRAVPACGAPRASWGASRGTWRARRG
jgi:hypothetical protein